MCPRIIVSAHAPVEITKPYKIGSGHGVLEAEARVFWGVLNGMKGQTIQRKTAIRDTEVTLNIFCEWS